LPITYVWDITSQDGLTQHSGISTSNSVKWDSSGVQNILVTSMNAAGAVSASHAITIYTPVHAAFAASLISGSVPLSVTFTNLSTGEYSQSLWDFGDGSSSSLQHPSHTYTLAGIYPVTLTVSGPGGMDAMVRPNHITVGEAVQVQRHLRLPNIRN
jgi:PKD repeat protein